MTPEALRNRRLQLGLSQGALARALSVARNTVARWERGDLQIRHPELIQMAVDRLATEKQLASDMQSQTERTQHSDAARDFHEDGGQCGNPSLHALPPEFTSFIGR
jgi:transcriptional regulator with XRE-family HTH domain